MTTEQTAAASTATTEAATQTAAAATTQAATQTAATTQSQSSESQAAASDEGDLITGAEATAEAAQTKSPETPAEKRAALESKATDDAAKEALKGKTDAEIEELFKADSDAEAEKAALGDFDETKLTLPQDMPIPEEMKSKVADLAKIFNNKELTAQEKTQKAIDLHVEMQNKQLEDFKNVKNGWRDSVKNNPELAKMVGPANDAVRKFAGTPAQLEELQGGLKMLGLGNHPAFVRMMGNVAKAMADDTMSGDSRNTQGQSKDLASMMYPDMKQASS